MKNSVLEIFKKLNDKKIYYMIARNYEKFPYFDHDIDLFCDTKLVNLKKILINIAKKNSWDCMVYDNHFADKLNKYSNIEVFHFYKFISGKYECLHLDFFSGTTLSSLPLIHASEIKRKRKKNFYQIDLAVENLLRIFTLNTLIMNNDEFKKGYAIKKIKIYKKKILKYKKKLSFKLYNETFFLNIALNYLKKSNFKKFSIYVNISRFIYMIKFIFKNPFRSVYYILLRIIELSNHFFFHQTGLQISFNLKNPKQKKLIYKSLNLLKNLNFLSYWKIKNIKYFLNIQERKILERNGAIISINSKLKNCVIFDNTRQVTNLLLKKIIKNNQIIYKSPFLNKIY